MKAIEGQTCESSWLAAVEHLLGCERHETHNLIVEISQPTQHLECDIRLRTLVDEFLRRHDAQPLTTVAETIFPAAEYKRTGANGVYETYPNEIYPEIKGPNEWGRYAYRLVRRQTPGGGQINPLEIVVEKLKTQLSNG